MIYLDHNATTPVSNEVLQAMMPFFQESFGNASSFYKPARSARAAIADARNTVAECIHASPGEIIFTGSGTEADNLCLRGVARAFYGREIHIITSSIEHHAILNTCRDLEEQGVRITRLPADACGRVDPDTVLKNITDNTVLISIMYANNETGVIQPIEAVSEIARKKGILFHTDAVQAFGKIPVSVEDLGVDLMTICAHKIYGPKGAGALYVRKGTAIAPVITGGMHEMGMRAGTENVPAVIGFAKAAETAVASLDETSVKVGLLRDSLENRIKETIDRVIIHGSEARRIPNTASISFAAIDGESILLHLDLREICASTGSACATGSSEPSHVLRAMGVSPIDAASTIRFSLGRSNTSEEIDVTVKALQEIAGRLRSISSIHNH
ncbi:MAG: cysteine desulfurase [Deltaproteobacteria bacterium]|nr:cysteine desulfurase [Deltaproteobacteria bacterium]